MPPRHSLKTGESDSWELVGDSRQNVEAGCPPKHSKELQTPAAEGQQHKEPGSGLRHVRKAELRRG